MEEEEEETDAYVPPPAPATAPNWSPEEEADLLGGAPSWRRS